MHLLSDISWKTGICKSEELEGVLLASVINASTPQAHAKPKSFLQFLTEKTFTQTSYKDCAYSKAVQIYF